MEINYCYQNQVFTHIVSYIYMNNAHYKLLQEYTTKQWLDHYATNQCQNSHCVPLVHQKASVSVPF